MLIVILLFLILSACNTQDFTPAYKILGKENYRKIDENEFTFVKHIKIKKYRLYPFTLEFDPTLIYDKYIQDILRQYDEKHYLSNFEIKSKLYIILFISYVVPIYIEVNADVFKLNDNKPQ
jgi:hypothetical protein